LLGVEAVGLHDSIDVIQSADFGQVLVGVLKQRSMDIGLPGQEPLCREWQLPFAGGATGNFLVQAKEAFVRQICFTFQDLQACAQLDQCDGTLDLLGIIENAFGGHGLAPENLG
jgi:hypothetical protein